MKLFSNFKKTTVKYFVKKIENIPSGIYSSIEKYSNIIHQSKCPAVAMTNNRFYYANSFLNIDIEFGLKENDEPFYSYVFGKEHPPFKEMHSLIDRVVKVAYVNDAVNLQVISPYLFVTDDKNVEVITIPPNIEYENCVYVPGGLKPYYWLRNLNSVFMLSDKTKMAKVKFRINKPMLFFYFNKPVDLKYMEATEKIKSYHSQVRNIIAFRSGLEKYYMNVVNRRPRKLL